MSIIWVSAIYHVTLTHDLLTFLSVLRETVEMRSFCWRCRDSQEMPEVFMCHMMNYIMLTLKNPWRILQRSLYSEPPQTEMRLIHKHTCRRCDLLPAWLQILRTGGWSWVMVSKWGRLNVTLHRANPPDQRGPCQPSIKVRSCRPLTYPLT